MGKSQVTYETENKNQKIKKKIRSQGFARTKNKIPSINKA